MAKRKRKTTRKTKTRKRATKKRMNTKRYNELASGSYSPEQLVNNLKHDFDFEEVEDIYNIKSSLDEYLKKKEG